MQLDERSETQAKGIRVGLGKGGAQDLIEDESRFEVGAGQRVFDPADAMAQVEPSRMLLRSGKQALQPPPKVGSLADVGLGVGVRAAQKKHGRGGSYDGEHAALTFRAQLDPF